MNDSSSFQKPIITNITAAAQVLDITSPNQATEIIQAQGTWTGTLVVEGSNDGSNYYILEVRNENTKVLSTSITSNGVYSCNTNGYQYLRARSSAWTSGTANITVYGSDAASLINSNSILRNTSGTEIGTAASPIRTDPTGTTTQPVSGTVNVGNFPATQNVVVTSSVEVEVKNDSGNPLPVTGSLGSDADYSSSYSPDYSSEIIGTSNLLTDNSGRLETHSTVLSDEGSFRDDFAGNSISVTLTGTVSFTNGSTIVTGVGTNFTTLKYYDYIKLQTDSNTAYAQIASITDDLNLVLTSPYTGTTGSGLASYSQWIPLVGTGGSITVASGFVNILSGTSNGSITSLKRFGDYLPYIAATKFSISQRIANQTISWGFVDDPNNPVKQVQFIFNGTNDKQVICRSSGGPNAADVQTTTVTLTGSFSTSAYNRYEIDITADQVNFLINGNIVANHLDHLPGPYDNLSIWFYINNSATVTSTTLSCDYLFFSNIDQLEITNNFKGEPLPTQLFGTNASTGLLVPLQLDSNGNLIVSPLGGTGADFAFGDVSTTGTSLVSLRRTVYTEQSTNGQRSIASSSASDTAAGIGARQVKITYFDQAGVGPYTEILTLNGTNRVISVNTNICYIEEMVVTTVGSTGTNVGTITLYTLPAGGTAIGTIGIGANQTFWAHHYVPSGKTCRISGISGSTDQTSSAYALLLLKAQTIPVGNNSELQISDTSRVYGGAAPTVRNYNSPIPVTGPSRITMYVQPSSNASQNTFGSFDFTES